MARRRGFLAELQHQAKVAARQAEQAQRAAAREREAAIRRAEQARRLAERAAAQAARASEQERRRAQQEAKRLHVEAMEAEVAELNATLAETYEEIDSLLAATLNVDDYVDLETLRQRAVHPQFPRPDLERPLPKPAPLVPPSEPVYRPPDAPKGIAGVFGRKKHAEATAAAKESHQDAIDKWKTEVATLPDRQREADEAYQRAEARRQQELAEIRRVYELECAEHERAVAESNAALDELIAGLAYGTPEAVQEYISIVLSNSVYPDEFEVEHDFSFDAQGGELTLNVLVPDPGQLPTIKAYRYVKSSDEITSTGLSQKQRKDRYATAVHCTALRSLHEIFEADRRGLIQAISLELGTNAVHPATGNITYVPFVAVVVQREMFMNIDLSAVVPAATLEHLGATVSKNPLDLVPIDPSGVRTT